MTRCSWAPCPASATRAGRCTGGCPDGSDALFATNPGNAVVRVDGASSLRTFALAGAGVTVLPRWLIEDDLAQDRLRPVLRQHRFPQQSVYAVYPHSTQPSPKVRQLIDFLRGWSESGRG